ncbi:MAG: Fic family protein [Acholeplasmatales bacterium]|nr:Fic family protein [Acholeplasmatales bacterium]
MKYLTSKEIAIKWNTSERSVRNYCATNRVNGAYLEGKTWMIPEDAAKPTRKNGAKRTLYNVLTSEMKNKIKGGIYHRLQIDMTYNSNHIEGSTLTIDQTRFIFETKTIGKNSDNVNIDDVIETKNHFRCIDYVISNAKNKLSESFIKELHYLLKNGTSDSYIDWFKVGEYKAYDNEVGGNKTTKKEDVSKEMKLLIDSYNKKEVVTINDIIDFHYKFESIHPFQDGNGRVGRLIMFKECLKYDIVPILITDEYKYFYYRGLKEYNDEKGYLIDTCLNGQDILKKQLDYFEIVYKENK